MALLDMLVKDGYCVEVGHVNYHKRDTALRDEKIVRKYCKNNNIKFHLMNYKPENASGNFQASAREARYKFFSKACKQKGLECVLVAHHKDDLIETYIMQTQKNLSCSYLGLAPSVYLYYVIVKRPLLGYTKQELLDYCNNNNLEYGIDESNLSDYYTRNKIRHSKVEKMTDKEKNNLVNEINRKNKKMLKDLTRVISRLDAKKDYKTSVFIKIPNIKLGLRAYFGNKSDKFYEEMLRQIKDSKKYLYKGESFWLSKEYDVVHIFDKPVKYEFKFNNINMLYKNECEYFKVSKIGKGVEAVNISKDDFPITIKNAEGKESIKLRFGSKKINRYFIDRKITIKDRMQWPVVFNRRGTAILVPGIGCDIDHYDKNPNCYVIKL